ncbi:ATP-binding protein [Sphingobacterium griseoflavum]|uniref:histidine kinase n=1 Tax=Sphingobacterium griseoflavum TaxID=1474952 RepID=A0ABQ3HYH5_9SPHI|nr:ATP-binding protein [Sphingobacterium griseoflavum]GHE35663.1 PAS domain-containing sensor histidine kinase [Sphingobacterium griseoflavum]
MKIKTKLTIGIGMLFLVIFMLSALSGWYFNRLKKDTANILASNYSSLEHVRGMLGALEDLSEDPTAFPRFEKYLQKQLSNITEEGEQETTGTLAQHFLALQQDSSSIKVKTAIRRDLGELLDINMESIGRKEKIAEKNANTAIIVISFAGTLGFVVAFTLLINLPPAIANPIKELTGSIREIANQNYRERVHFERHDEFGELARSFNSMAEKLEEYTESKLDKLLRSKKRIEALIEQMHDPVFGLDECEQVIFANHEALKISGLKIEEILGKKVQEIAMGNDLVRNVFQDIVGKDNAQQLDRAAMKIYADNKESYFEKEIIDIHVVPTGERNAQSIGHVVLLKNITPFKELDLAKTNFIGTVSHEFKTPIASIQMGVTLLENERVGPLNQEQQDLVNGIREDTERLLGITGELLHMAQLESGSIQLNLHPSEIVPIITYAVNANRSAAVQKNIDLLVNIEPGLDQVYADDEKTAWVLTNFVSNAIRYSYENASVNIEVRRVNEKVIFSVIDRGQGIEPKYLDRVFERYFRIPGAKKGGTGLGLSISKEFIEAQGGMIGVKSEYGAGCVFYFALKGVG